MTHDLATAPDIRVDRSALVRRRLVAAALAASALTAAGTILLRPIAALDWHDYTAFAAVRDAAWTFALVAGTATGAAFLTLGLAGCLLVGGRGSMLATVGASLTGLGSLGFASGFFASGALNWYATAGVVPEPAARALTSFAEHNPTQVFGPQIAGFLLASSGCFLVAAALWRSRVVPRWIPIAVPVTFVLMIMAGTGVAYDVMLALFMTVFVAIAWQVWRDPSPVTSQR